MPIRGDTEQVVQLPLVPERRRQVRGQSRVAELAGGQRQVDGVHLAAAGEQRGQAGPAGDIGAEQRGQAPSGGDRVEHRCPSGRPARST